MKRSSVLLSVILSLFSFISCSNSDDDADLFPEGTATLYMMNEDNGKTILGNSDVYITRGGNFTSSRYPVFDMGQKSGLSDIKMPDFVNAAPQVAVQPGNGYVICDGEDIHLFEESGERAIEESALIYRVRVDSWIKKGDSITGANVRFLLSKPEKDYLPMWNSTVGTFDINPSTEIDKRPTVDIKLPTSNSKHIEVILEGDANEDLTYTLTKNILSFKLTSWNFQPEYTVTIRCQHIFTRVFIKTKWMG